MRLAQARLAAKQNADAASKDLAAVASATDVAYETRLSAAKSLSGSVSDLGSKELNLMVGSQTAAPGDANQPYFFAARMKAAESLPASARVALLRAVLEDNPAADSVRAPLLKAAFESGDYHLAIATLKPYLMSMNLETALDGTQEPEESEEVTGQDWQANGTLNAFIKLSEKERAEICRDLGTAFDKTNALSDALPYLRKAYRLETDAAIKTQINKEVQQIRFIQRRRAANQTRRPEIHAELEQEHIVRPRLPEQVVSSPPVPQGPARKGASQ
jgi:hypothetical protein